MKLPEINYGGVPDEVSPELVPVRAATDRLSSTMQAGLTAIAQESIKAQTTDAHLKLSQGLSDLESDLRMKKSFDPQELKDRLGPGYEDSIPEAVRKEGEGLVPVFGENGEPLRDESGAVQVKPKGIPTYHAARALYQNAAEKLISKAADGITGDGWQNAFRRTATGDVIQRWSRVEGEQLQELRRDQVDTVGRQVQQLTLARDWPTALARIDSAREILGDDGQVKLRQHVYGVQQTTPIYDALKHFSIDPSSPISASELKDAAKRLADPQQMSMVDAQHQASLARQVHAALKQVDGQGGKRDASTLAFEIMGSSPDDAHPDLVDPGKAFDKLDAEFKTGGRFAARPELRPEAGSILQKLVSERNERVNYNFDKAAGTAIGQYLELDANNTARPSITNIDAVTRAALEASGKKGQELLDEFRRKDRTNELEGRQMRQLPTDAQAAYLLNLETWMRKHPDEARKEDPNAFAVKHFSNLPVPYFNRVLELYSEIQRPTHPVQVEAAKGQLDDLLKDSGLLPKKGHQVTHTQVEARNQLQGELSTWLTQQVQAGKPADDKATGEWIRGRLRDVEVPKPWYWPNATRPQVQAEVEGTPFLDPDTGRIVTPPTKTKTAPAVPAAPAAPSTKTAPSTKPAARKPGDRFRLKDGRVVEIGQDGKPTVVLESK